jgi:tetratricopeptide (TPR) repeat protein
MEDGMSIFALGGFAVLVLFIVVVLVYRRKRAWKLASLHVRQGNAMAKSGGYDAAILEYTKAITLYPKADAPYQNRGNVYLHDLNDYGKALADFEKAVELLPKPDSVYGRGLTYKALGKVDQALHDFDLSMILYEHHADALKPTYALHDLLCERGEVYLMAGNNDKGYEDLKRAAELGSSRAKNMMETRFNQLPVLPNSQFTQTQETDALSVIKRILLQSSGARDFLSRAKQAGFIAVEEDPLGGIILQKHDVMMIFSVFESQGPDRIWCLTVKDGDKPTVNLVDEGKIVLLNG